MDKAVFKYIFILFITTRIALTIIGSTSKFYFNLQDNVPFKWSYIDIHVIDIWGVWDSGYYLDIAKRGYANDQNFAFDVSISDNELGKIQTNLGFFPAYPVLIKITSFVFKNYYLSAILVSNLALLAGSYLLYKLVHFKFGEGLAKRSVKYLFLFPTAFIYSGVFTESISLLLFVLVFYMSENEKWFKGSLAGAILTLTKFTGFLSVIPIFLIAREGKNLNKHGPYLSVILITLSLGAFFLYLKESFGDPFINFQTKINAWNIIFQNPFDTLTGLFAASFTNTDLRGSYWIILSFILGEFLLLTLYFTKLPLAYSLTWLILLITTLLSGLNVTIGMPRHSLLIFPQYIALSLLTKNRYVDFTISLIFIFLQILFMALWVNGIAII